jgi:hypothetical protein
MTKINSGASRVDQPKRKARNPSRQDYAFCVKSGKLDLNGGVSACLPAKLRERMEAVFSADFSDVRIHVGPQAERVNAAAFALASDIYFAPDRCQLDSPEGLQLLGHELTHVLQQRRRRITGRSSGLIVVQNRELEMEADRMGWVAATECLRMKGLTKSGAQPSWRPAETADRRGASLHTGVIQRRFYIGSKGFSNHDGNLADLAKKVLPFAATSIVSEVDQTLWRFDFQGRRFKTMIQFLSALNEAILLDRYEKAEPVPKYLHHFWAGGALSEGAITNLHCWRIKAESSGWYQYILTDGVVNAAFGDVKLQKQLEVFHHSGSVVVDIAQVPFASKPVYEQLRKSVVEKGIKAKLPYLSDLARYAQLLAMGGLYVDVDVHPGAVHMNEMLTSLKGIPQLGPCFRTRDDAKLHGFFDPLEAARMLAIVLMYSKDKLAIGNHFIAAPARNAVVAKANEIATSQVSEFGITNGGIDFLKAFSKLDGYGMDAVQASLPAWAMDVQWVTPESDKIVD